jgi:hypothetical protein
MEGASCEVTGNAATIKTQKLWVRQGQREMALPSAPIVKLDLKPASHRASRMAKQPWRYSLRTLLVVMMAVSILAYLAIVALHILIFVTAIILAIGTTAAFLWARGRVSRKRSLIVGMLGSWLFLYVASVGPAAALFEGRGVADEICEFVYGPLIIVDAKLPNRPMDGYADQWKRMLGK